MVGDSAMAVLIALFDLLLVTVDGEQRMGPPAPDAVLAVIIVATVAPLVIRRRHPMWFAYLVLAIGAVHAAYELGLAAVATACIAVYTLIVYVNRRQTAIYFVVMVVSSAVQILIQFDRAEWLIALGFTGGSLGFCWVLGEFVGARRAYRAEMEARLHLLETERDQASQIAVAAERSRIARELHDVIAHAVSVIVVQADGAMYTIERDPATARDALRTIAETGRGALDELRGLLDVLRGSGDAAEQPLAPQPGIAALPELAERMRAAGMPVRLELDGDFVDVSTGVELGVFRIVQEALTNTLKHAGRTASASVTVTQRADSVEVDVVDDGAGKARPVLAPALTDVAGGNGLIGMRERASVFGGRLNVGPEPGGGWRVHAVIPHQGRHAVP
uniref:sensor histidine kinase n=1 Tax=Haloechinothrix halophila TaxID=1069073 RepID=UPI0005525C3B|nr:histidine kinase [Haloechinothrix halophila]